jgi:hypothetical protein
VAAIRLLPERQCHKCKRQKDWGCEAERVPSGPEDHTAAQDENGEWWGWSNPAHLPIAVDGEETWACPRQDLKRRPQEWNTILFYYEFYRDKGLLPQPGSVMDQSNKALSIFRILNDVNAECDKAQADRARANREQPPPTPQRGSRR